jgi:hypothetical protein
MAATERVSLVPMTREIPKHLEVDSFFMPGIRVMARTTTSSLADYPEWKVDEKKGHRRDAVVTDGACS